MSAEHEKQLKKMEQDVAAHGWSVHRINSRGYRIMHCGCGKHSKSVPKTPSNPNTIAMKTRSMIAACST